LSGKLFLSNLWLTVWNFHLRSGIWKKLFATPTIMSERSNLSCVGNYRCLWGVGGVLGILSVRLRETFYLWALSYLVLRNFYFWVGSVSNDGVWFSLVSYCSIFPLFSHFCFFM
jgi:hypothetical protein